MEQLQHVLHCTSHSYDTGPEQLPPVALRDTTEGQLDSSDGIWYLRHSEDVTVGVSSKTSYIPPARYLLEPTAATIWQCCPKQTKKNIPTVYLTSVSNPPVQCELHCYAFLRGLLGRFSFTHLLRLKQEISPNTNSRFLIYTSARFANKHTLQLFTERDVRAGAGLMRSSFSSSEMAVTHLRV